MKGKFHGQLNVAFISNITGADLSSIIYIFSYPTDLVSYVGHVHVYSGDFHSIELENSKECLMEVL